MAISLQIVELWGVGGFRPLTDFKKPGLNRVKIGDLLAIRVQGHTNVFIRQRQST